MKLYLNDKEHSIPFLHLLDLMMVGAMESNILNLLSEDSIANTTKFSDPVLEFLNYYIEDAELIDQYPEGRIHWIKNALYQVKGSPIIVDVIRQALELEIEYMYDSYELNITKISQLKVKNIALFYDKFYKLMYYLLYYDKFSMLIEELIIRLNDKLTTNNYIGIKGFNIIETEDDGIISD